MRKLTIEAGDILLLFGRAENLSDAVDRLGCLPLAERGLQVLQRQKAWLAVSVFAAAILLASLSTTAGVATEFPGQFATGCVGTSKNMS